MNLSTLTALTWNVLVLAATLGRLARLPVPGLAVVTAALFALAPPTTKSTGIMLAVSTLVQMRRTSVALL